MSIWGDIWADIWGPIWDEGGELPPTGPPFVTVGAEGKLVRTVMLEGALVRLVSVEGQLIRSVRSMGKIFALIIWLSALPVFAQQTIDPRLLPSGVPQQMQVDGVNLPAQPTVNFQTSPTIDPANPSAGIIQHSVIDASITDAKIAGTGITTRSKLPAPICYEDEACTFGGAISIGTAGSFSILGSTSGVITITRQAAAGTYNFNLPTTAGTSGQPLRSGGGGAAPMTFGTLGLIGGGTNQTSWTAARCVRVNAGGTGLESAAADCGTGGGGAITLIQGTANEIGVTGGTGPTTTVSLPTILSLGAKTLSGAAPLKFDGATADSFATSLTVTNPTANRAFTLPNADSVAIQPQTCATGFRFSSVSALGVITCAKVVESIAVNAITGAYTVVDGDFAKLLSISNVSAVPITLPDPEGTGFDVGWFAHFQNRGVGTVTITSTTSTIDGSASLTLLQNQGVLIASDGVNYFTQRGIGGAGVSTSSINVYGNFLQDFGAATLELPNSPGAAPGGVGQITLDTTTGATKIQNSSGIETFAYASNLAALTFGLVAGVGRADYGANSIPNALRIGSGTTRYVGIGDDPTSGPFATCFIDGIMDNCNKGGKVLDGKFFHILDSLDVPILRVLGTITNSYIEMREASTDPAGDPPTGRQWLYPKAGGWYAQNSAGTVSGPLGAGVQVIQFCGNDPAVNDTDYLSLNDCAANLTLTSASTDGKWMAGFAGTVVQIGCRVSDAPGASNTSIITVTKQLAATDPGAATSPTTMTFTLSSVVSGNTTANPLAFAVGDFLGMQKVDSVSAAASNAVKCYMKVQAS